MAKLIQITASQNDLFGLDSDGFVCQYNFNTNKWMELGDERGGREDLSRGDAARDEKPRAGAPSPTEGPRNPRGVETPVVQRRA
jgi:hypothetical protein